MTKKLVLALALLTSALWVSAVFLGTTPLYAEYLTPRVLLCLAGVSKLTSLATGAVFAGRIAAGSDPEVRSTWRLMQAWLTCFCLGQLVLTGYEVGKGVAPVPSLGDPLFSAGYLAVIVAEVRFIGSYRRTGFAFAPRRETALVLAGVAAAFTFVSSQFLGSIARADVPFWTRVVNVEYPVMDFIVLAPALVLLRMAFAFRGGRLWSVWGTLLTGIVAFTAGDILFALPLPGSTWIAPLSDISYVLGYAAAAMGVLLQHDLLEG
jgi:hypothetical protein